MKLKRMNSKIWTVALVVATFATGCQKFLDRDPLGRYVLDEVQGSSFESEVFGAYANLRQEGVAGLPYIAIHGMRSDDSDKGSATNDGADAEGIFDNFQYRTDFWLMNNYWTHHYRLIQSANNVIVDINESGSTEPAVMINLAEAKFIRAYAYFNLVRTFGEIPKVDFRVTELGESNIAKSPSNVIFELIDADLQDAVAYLPTEWPADFAGRLTKGAAFALQAKTYLWRSNWGMALSAAESVINLGKYSLVTDYQSIFRETGENNVESIFEIQAFYSPTITNLGTQYATVQGVRGAGVWNLGWGWNTPTENLAQAFETGDPRKDATLLYSGQVNTPYNENVPPATATIPRNYWNKKVYTNPAVRNQMNSQAGQWMNVRIIRYADVLLMAAEAANEIGGPQNITKAKGYLEEVRGRARGNSTTILPVVTTDDQDELRDAIRHERRVELGMENERFFDLVRWDIDVDVLHAHGKTGYQLKHRLMPIPQPEIDKSGGKLIQNPDYQ
ncbi:RagB/SusD family nutrient uptake outer membrane protein [Gynurincola endophyticus]|uniref:RagB/SusD family nutrient uptake outer membrane protein n=1 Tax=Gynurincola endophyticus TaxID=2479004 RepID=UPI0018F68294|nr:RagB/SusD family nutrient uptake outer membrane protein [Gynurincola endophyticus]